MLEHFHERQRLHSAPIILVVVAAGFEVALAMVMPEPLGARLVQWLSAAIFISLALLMRHMTVRVNAHQLIFGFAPLERQVELSTIRSVRLVESNLSKMGIGVHRTSDGMWAWIAKTGPAVEILIQDRRHPTLRGYIVSTNRPNDLMAALQSGQTNRSVELP